MAMDRRNYKQLVDTTVEIAQKVKILFFVKKHFYLFRLDLLKLLQEL